MPAAQELLITETLATIAFPFSHTTKSGSAKTVRSPKQAETFAVIDFPFYRIAQLSSVKTLRSPKRCEK